MKRFYITLIPIILSLVLFNCKKEEIDSEKPEVTVTSPSNNDEFPIGETINLTAVFKDNKGLKDCKVSLIFAGDDSGEGTPWSPEPEIITLSDTTHSVDQTVFGAIPDCKPGNYTLKLEVSDIADVPNVTTKEVSIKIIPTVPGISVEEPAEGSSFVAGEDFFNIKTVCTDNKELKELVCNIEYADATGMAKLKVATGVNDPWNPGEIRTELSGTSQEVELTYGQIAPSLAGNYKLVLEVFDALGNSTKEEINFVLTNPPE